MPPRGLSELVLIVPDVPAAAAFYRDLIGLIPARPPSDDWAWFWVGDPANLQRLAVHKGPLLFEEHSPRPTGARFGPTHFAFEVARPDLAAMVDRLRPRERASGSWHRCQLATLPAGSVASTLA